MPIERTNGDISNTETPSTRPHSHDVRMMSRVLPAAPISEVPAALHKHQESILASTALLLGPDTDYYRRVRAARRLARHGPALLPFLLNTLNAHPEIASPPWPWWPPQYEQVSRLLLYLSQNAQLSLDALLRHPSLSQPPGPVLWTGVVEAAGLLPHAGYEPLLSEGLAAPWSTVRYAAAMALANVAGKVTLCEPTRAALHSLLSEQETIPVRLAAACALLRNADRDGLTALMELLHQDMAEEARRAAIFVLATELPESPAASLVQRGELAQLLIHALEDENNEIAMHAARALRSVASLTTLPALCSLLASSRTQTQVAALTALEEIASRKEMREVIQHHTLPGHVVPLLRAEIPEVRRQASYTLAAFGGEYAAAVLGTSLLDQEHPGHLEAIEALRLLSGALRTPTRAHVIRWLLCALQQPREEVQVTALDSLSYLAWQARTQGKKQAFEAISHEITRNGTASQLLASPSAWVRQRSIELLSLLDNQVYPLRSQLLTLLHTDNDSGVRACISYILGQAGARWAIPSLLEALLDPDEYVAEAALNALGALASRDDSIVVYVMRELAACAGEESNLTIAARTWLKRWRKK